jgi:hypothetical protein
MLVRVSYLLYSELLFHQLVGFFTSRVDTSESYNLILYLRVTYCDLYAFLYALSL